jgi:hypothetical protein
MKKNPKKKKKGKKEKLMHQAEFLLSFFNYFWCMWSVIMGPKWHADHIIPCQCLDEKEGMQPCGKEGCDGEQGVFTLKLAGMSHPSVSRIV